MGRRRPAPPPTPPGEGTILVQVAIARMLRHHGVAPAEFARMAREGLLGDAPDRFDTRNGPGPLPEGLPPLHGVVTWRRAARARSLDVAHVEMAPGLHHWCATTPLADGTRLAKVRLDGTDLPDTALAVADGAPLSEILRHPWLDHPGIVIRRHSIYRPRTTGGPPGPADRPTMLSFDVEMPTEAHDEAG